MRGFDEKRAAETFTASPESMVPKDHPLRPIKDMADAALADLSPLFDANYSLFGRPSIPPERPLRALLVQILYSVRSERMLVEQLQYNMLFRWFVRMNGTEPVWNPSTYAKNRDRFLSGDVAVAFFTKVLDQAKAKNLVSEEHFSVDGTLVEAWASFKSLKAKDGSDDHRPPPDDPKPRLEERKAFQCHAPVQHRRRRAHVQEVQGLGHQDGLARPRSHGEPPRPGVRHHHHDRYGHC